MSERRPHLSMLRTFTVADAVTMVNAACGTGAILAAVRFAASHDATFAWAAIILLPIALVADVLDGTIARRTGRQSVLGADLDSLADVISFGAAPATLAFALGLDGAIDAAVLVFFVACGISRLARYNATHEQLAGSATGKVPYYEGTPIPTSLALVLVLAIALGTGATGDAFWGGVLTLGPARFHPLVLMFAASGCAMVSASLRIPKP